MDEERSVENLSEKLETLGFVPEYRRRIEKLRAMVSEREKEMERLTDALAAKKMEKDRLKKEREKLASELSSVTVQRDGFKFDLQMAESKMMAQKSEIENLVKTNEKLTSENKRLGTSLDYLRSIYLKFGMDTEKAEKRFEKRLSEMGKTLNAERANRQQLEQKVAFLQEEKTKAYETVHGLTSANQSLEAQLRHSMEELNGLNSVIQNFDAQETVSQMEIVKLNDQIGGLTSMNQSLKEQLDRSNEENKSLQVERARFGSVIQRFRTQITILQQEKTVSDEKIGGLTSKIHSLKEDLLRSVEEKNIIQAELRKRISGLEIERTGLVSHVGQMEAEINGFSNEHTRLNLEIQRLQTQVTLLQNQKADLVKDIGDFGMTIQSLKDQVEQRSLEILEERNKASIKIRSLEDTVEKTQSRLDGIRNDSASMIYSLKTQLHEENGMWNRERYQLVEKVGLLEEQLVEQSEEWNHERSFSAVLVEQARKALIEEQKMAADQVTSLEEELRRSKEKMVCVEQEHEKRIFQMEATFNDERSGSISRIRLLEDQVIQLEQEHEDNKEKAKSELDSEKAKVVKSVSKIQSLKEELLNSKIDTESVEDVLKKLVSDNEKAFNGERKRLASKIQQLESQVSKLREKIAKSKEEIRGLNFENHLLKEKLDRSVEGNKHVQQEHKEHVTKMEKDFNDELNQLNARIQELEAQMTIVREEKLKLEVEICCLATTNQSLKDDLRRSNDESKFVQEKLNKLTDLIGNLREQVSVLEEQKNLDERIIGIYEETVRLGKAEAGIEA